MVLHLFVGEYVVAKIYLKPVLFQDGFFYFSPLPIPIRQLADKPASADGTVPRTRDGRVCRRQNLYKNPVKSRGFFI